MSEKKNLNSKSDIVREACNKQRNLWVNLISSRKRNFFSNINTSDITNNKSFWKRTKPISADKIKTNSKKILIEKRKTISSCKVQEKIVSEKIISDGQTVAEISYNFVQYCSKFENIYWPWLWYWFHYNWWPIYKCSQYV